ncbi:MAG: T9SS type A sorting domain-containing protein [Candidatus Cloacimonadales bacterium]
MFNHKTWKLLRFISKMQGVHKVVWQGTDSNNRQVASGVYFYRINSANKKSITKKIILMK